MGGIKIISPVLESLSTKEITVMMGEIRDFCQRAFSLLLRLSR